MPYHQFTISITDPHKNSLINRMNTLGCLGIIDNVDNLIAYFPDTIPVTTIAGEFDLIQALLETSGAKRALTYGYEELQEQDWNESWKKGFTPIDVGARFTILPPWEQEKSGRVNLIIDPGMAFGTGHHETTRSCLVLMDTYFERMGKDRFLDLGTGTGLLALAAVSLGYKEVVAIDIDPLAIEATQRNLALNHLKVMELHEGDISFAKGAFDVIAANLISGALVELAPKIADCLAPSGIAILSGILRGQEDEVNEAMKKAGLALVEKLIDGKWVSLVCGS